MRHGARWLALAVAGLVGAPACGDEFGIDDVLGIWNTHTINGYAVPGTVVYEGVTYQTAYVRWTFYDGGLCTLTQQVDDITATYDSCEYTIDADQETIAIVLLSQEWNGSVDGSRMTLTDPQSVVWILRAQ